jgi:hypothetical protein
MTLIPSSQSVTLSLRPRARLLRTIGDELISSEMVAVIELVKNAYDAEATGCVSLSKEKNQIALLR